METRLLTDSIRPHCPRDDCGDVGEAIHQCADWLMSVLPQETVGHDAHIADCARRIEELLREYAIAIPTPHQRTLTVLQSI